MLALGPMSGSPWGDEVASPGARPWPKAAGNCSLYGARSMPGLASVVTPHSLRYAAHCSCKQAVGFPKAKCQTPFATLHDAIELGVGGLKGHILHRAHGVAELGKITGRGQASPQ